MRTKEQVLNWVDYMLKSNPCMNIEDKNIFNAIKYYIKENQTDKDLISREAVLDIFGDIHPLDYNARAYVAQIKELPSVEVKPIIYGKWIGGRYWSEGCGMGEDYGYYYKCSLCGNQVKGGYTNCGYKYCSKCGAEMEEE